MKMDLEQDVRLWIGFI